jgi:hypothetical protein
MLQYTVYKTTTDEKKQIDAPLNSSLGDRLRLIGQHEQLLNPTLAVKTFVGEVSLDIRAYLLSDQRKCTKTTFLQSLYSSGKMLAMHRSLRRATGWRH